MREAYVEIFHHSHKELYTGKLWVGKTNMMVNRKIGYRDAYDLTKKLKILHKIGDLSNDFVNKASLVKTAIEQLNCVAPSVIILFEGDPQVNVIPKVVWTTLPCKDELLALHYQYLDIEDSSADDQLKDDLFDELFCSWEELSSQWLLAQ